MVRCWEFMKCDNQHKCPACPDYGQQCARVAGTMCDGEVHGVFAQKYNDCRECPFYKSEHYDKTYGDGEKDPLKKDKK